MESEEDLVQQFKLKRLIKKLEEAKGNGTSMITVIIPAGKKISDIQKMLQEEVGKADKIKDRVNRQSVVRAINSCKEKLKYYNKIPNNGLLIYCGEVIAEDGKTERKMVVDFEPMKAINTSLYKCSNQFDTSALKALLTSKEKYGFIIVDGSGALYGVVQGNARDVLLKFTVDLPKKHGRGGQSSQRFARIRMEKRQNYVRKVCENAIPLFITDDRPNVEGIIIAGCADFKVQVAESAVFDQRLKKIICNIVDISYGGEQGFNQAIELSKGCLCGLKLVQEQQIIGKLYEEINMDSGKIIYGINDTMKVFLDGAVERLICFDNLAEYRVSLIDKRDGTKIIKYLKPAQVSEFFDKEKHPENDDFDIEEKEALVDWLAEHHRDFGSEIVFITDASPEGSQFVKGFGGLGGFLRFKYEMEPGQGFDNYVEEEDEGFI
jgi:peptide chain release factor subunit 1